MLIIATFFQTRIVDITDVVEICGEGNEEDQAMGGERRSVHAKQTL